MKLSLNDIYHEPYFLRDGSVNPESRLFAGWSQDSIKKYLQSRQ